MNRKGLVLLSLMMATGLPISLSAEQNHVIVISGLGGAQEYRDRFYEWSIQLVDAAIDRHRIPADQVVFLAEQPDRDPDRIRARSTWENIQTAITEVAEHAAFDDLVLIVLIGHGSFSGSVSHFNLPGPDPTVVDFAVALNELRDQQVAFVNTATASGEFIAGLSGPKRTIITATKTARERNETKFGEFFVEAFAGRVMPEVETPTATNSVNEIAIDDVADANKDGRVSLLEAFDYTRRQVARVYEESGLLLTEHAMLDDNGDGYGSDEPDPLTAGADGRIAQALFFTPSGRLTTAELETDDPTLMGLYAERNAIEKRVLAHRTLRDGMDSEIYEQELERLLIDLALKNREIRNAEDEVPQP